MHRYTVPFLSLLILMLMSGAARADTTVYVNGTEILSDVPPMVSGSEFMVPLRAIGECMGATVTWDDATRTVTIIGDNSEVKLTINGKAYKDGRELIGHYPSKLVNGRTMVPLKFITVALWSKVRWDNTMQDVYITSIKQGEDAKGNDPNNDTAG